MANLKFYNEKVLVIDIGFYFNPNGAYDGPAEADFRNEKGKIGFTGPTQYRTTKLNTRAKAIVRRNPEQVCQNEA